MIIPLNPDKFGRQKQMTEPESGYLPALRVPLYYLIFSALWILLSDQFLASFDSDPEMLTKLQTYKGEFFVVTSVSLLYILLKNEIHRRDFVEQSWRQSERQYRQLVEQASDGIFIVDGSGRYADINPSGCEMLGYEREELLGMSFVDLLAEDGLQQHPLQISELKKGSHQLVESKMFRKDGSNFYAEINAKSLDACRLLDDVEYLKPALDIPFWHHEWFNGDGYPHGLSGEEIPIAARIFAVDDVWDSLRSERTYRPAWSVSEVRKYLKDQAGIQFDPEVVERFLEIIPDEEEQKG